MPDNLYANPQLDFDEVSTFFHKYNSDEWKVNLQ